MKKIKLTQEAHIEGTSQDLLECWYEAEAEDEDGEDYTVRWEINPEWAERESNPETADADEGDACDWYHPSEVRFHGYGDNIVDEVEVVID